MEGGTGCVHGGVAAADHNHVAQRHFPAGPDILQPANYGYHVAGQVQPSGFPGAYGKEDVGVARGQELADGRSGELSLTSAP